MRSNKCTFNKLLAAMFLFIVAMPEHTSGADNEISLDPQNWEAFAELAHKMVDDTLTHVRTLRSRPAWQAMPQAVRYELQNEPVPMLGQGEREVYEQFNTHIRLYNNGNPSPKFFGWVQGGSFPLGFMSDMLGASINPHMAGFNQAPAEVERKVIDWLRQLMSFPNTTSGLLVSGGSMASITAMAVARDAKAGWDVSASGLFGDRPVLTIYGTTQTHNWADKCVRFLGFGSASYRKVPTHSDFTMDVDALRAMVAADRQQGKRPIVVIATAGTVNTGATDDMEALAAFCKEQDLWLHVDGAFGALIALSPKYKHLVKGMEKADSLAFDLHKWFYLPFEIACVLVRNGDLHRRTFANTAPYLQPQTRGVIAGGIPFAELGVELTRGFKALKAWMSMKAYGVSRFATVIEQNVDQAHYLGQQVSRESELELMAPVSLNVVNFRFRSQLSLDKLNALNQELLLRLQEHGLAIPSSTVLDGAFCIRVCITNHRTRRSDLDELIASSLQLGREIVQEWSNAAIDREL